MKTMRRTFLILYWAAVIGIASGLMLAGCGKVLDGVNHKAISRK